MPPAVCARLVRFLHASLIVTIILVSFARAQERDPGALTEIPLPGGLRAALTVIDDPTAPDRSQFLLDLIRRSYQTPMGPRNDPREATLRALLARLDAASSLRPSATAPVDTLPLPLPVATWTDVVFGGRATAQNLVSAILRSRSASLFYCGLLSLDDGTRAWLAARPDLISELASRQAAPFMVAAPGLRVIDGAVRVPGGDRAEPAWQALVGRRTIEPADFVRALLSHGEGRLAYFFAAMAMLTPEQIRFAMNLDAADPAARVEATRRLYTIFERMAPLWKLEDRTYWRPSLDPALLAADLHVDERGTPVVPGTRRFWTTVFAEIEPGRAKPSVEEDPRTLASGEPVDFASLCEQVFKGDQVEQRRRYQLVLFASRNIRRLTPETARDAVDAVRAAGLYPALVTALERAKLTDVAVIASAGRRAAQLSSIDDDARAARALAQFQGILTLLTRASSRGGVRTESLAGAVSSLCAVELNERGDYEGRMVRWLEAHLRDTPAPVSVAAQRGEASSGELNAPAGPVEQDMLRILSGPPVLEPRFVDWEGTRYRVDLAAAESTRLMRLLGDDPRPFLSSARTLLGIADAVDEAGLTREGLTREGNSLEQTARAVGWDGSEHWEGSGAPERYRDVAAALRRAAREGDPRHASRLSPALRVLADDLLARGLMELAYAVALGQPDRAAIAAGDAAQRHDFGARSFDAHRSAAWRPPSAGAGTTRGWRVTGSLLGLDVALAEFSLTPLSSKPPLRRPELNSDDRKVFIEAVALVEPTSLTDRDRDTIVAALRQGRARLAATRTAGEAVVLADEIRLSPTRRSLLAWVVAHDPKHLAAFLSPSELFLLGLEGKPIESSLHAWGAPGEPRLGCLCLQLIDRRPWETVAGRWNSGILASALPDLNLRLAELLAELQMPAPLLGPVLAAATLDLVNNAVSRDQDDRRGPVEFVQALRSDQMEQYLALLTTDGPLVPSSDTPALIAAGVPR